MQEAILRAIRNYNLKMLDYLGEPGGWGHGSGNDFGRKLRRSFGLLKQGA